MLLEFLKIRVLPVIEYMSIFDWVILIMCGVVYAITAMAIIQILIDRNIDKRKGKSHESRKKRGSV